MSITGDAQNVNINGNLVVPSLSNKIRAPLIQFFDNTTLNTANGIWSSNTSGGLLYNGNVTASYYMGNASTLTSLTGAASGTYGSANAIPSVTVDSTGRITSVTSTPINTVATGTTGQIAFYNQSNVLGGSIGLGYNAGSQALTVGGSLSVGGDLFIAGNTYSGNNVVFNDAIVEIGNAVPNATTLGILMQRPSGNVMMAYLSTEGGGAYNNTLTFGYTFSGANGSLLTPDLGNVLPVHVLGSVTADSGFYGQVSGSNTISASTVSAQTVYSNISGATSVSSQTVSASSAFYGAIAGSNTMSASTVSATTLVGAISGSNTISGSSLTLGSNLSTSDTGSNVLTVTGNVSAGYLLGNASTLTSLTGASAATYGNASHVSQITVDATGRITGIANVEIASSTANLAQVVNLGNVTSNTVQFTNPTTAFVTTSNASIGGNALITGTSNLVGNTVASNISVFSISFGGTSNGYVRTISLDDAVAVNNVTTGYITVGGLSVTSQNPVFLPTVTALGTWSGTPTPALGGSSLAAFSATIGANITNFSPSGGVVNGTYTIYAVSGGSYTISPNVAGSVSNLSSSLSLTTGNRVIIQITYDGSVYYVNWTKYS